jgi:hypothetical protein
MGSLSTCPPNLLGWEGLRRERILVVIAIDQKGKYYHVGGHPCPSIMDWFTIN